MSHKATERVCDILDILWEKTDKEHPISGLKLTNALEQRTGANVDRATVEEMLHTLSDRYTGPGEVKCKEAERKNGSKYYSGYHLKRDFTAAEVEMLINDVMFSRMRTREQAETLIEKLKTLVSPYERKELAHSGDLPHALYTANTLVQRNLAFVQRVISGNLHNVEKEGVLSFRFNGYGSDHKLHEVPGKKGRYQNVLPLGLLESGGNYYLVCLPDGADKAFNLRLDLITRLEAAQRDKPRDRRRERIIQKATERDFRAGYLTKHLYMGYEREGDAPHSVYLRVEKYDDRPDASLTFLHDSFGSNYEVLFENGQYADVRVFGLTWSITAFVRQYIGRVCVTGPEPVKKEVEDTLRREFEGYFQKMSVITAPGSL